MCPRILKALTALRHFMKTKYFLIAFSFGLFILACNKKSKKIIISEVAIESIESDTDFIEPPPPPSLHFSKSMTLKECFLKLSYKEHPESNDTAYNFGVYQINNQFVAFFIESKAYKKNAQEWMTKKGSEYLDKYYPLSNSEFIDFGWKQVLDKVRSGFNEFIKTEAFRNSSLAKANSLRIRFDDAVLLKIK
jgi:hypothetical protein